MAARASVRTKGAAAAGLRPWGPGRGGEPEGARITGSVSDGGWASVMPFSGRLRKLGYVLVAAVDTAYEGCMPGSCASCLRLLDRRGGSLAEYRACARLCVGARARVNACVNACVSCLRQARMGCASSAGHATVEQPPQLLGAPLVVSLPQPLIYRCANTKCARTASACTCLQQCVCKE